MNILVTEDSKETLESIKNILIYNIDENIEVFEAENGVEALKIIKTKPIDILLTDIVMPHMNGFELIKSIKNDDNLKHIFVAAITGLSGDEQIKEVFACGADYYISKPIQQEDITARLKLIYKLVNKESSVSPEHKRDTFNPFNTPVIMNYYTIYTILQEDDFYQIIHHIAAIYPELNKVILKDFITILLKSYVALIGTYTQSFEIMLESSRDAIYLSCTNLNFIQALKKYENKFPSSYEIKYTQNSITIKIPIKEV